MRRKFSMCKDTRVERISPNYLFDIRGLFLIYCLISQCVLPCISYVHKTYHRLCFVVDWPKKMSSKDTSLVIIPTSYNIKKQYLRYTFGGQNPKIVFERHYHHNYDNHLDHPDHYITSPSLNQHLPFSP